MVMTDDICYLRAVNVTQQILPKEGLENLPIYYGLLIPWTFRPPMQLYFISGEEKMPREGRSQSNLTNGIETWDMFKPKETRGQIVFARIGKGWWPGIVIQGKDCGQYLANIPCKEWILWYGDERVSLDCAFQDGMDFLDKKKEKGEWAANGFLSESSKLLLSDNVKGSLERVKKALAPNNESTLEDMEASQEEEEEILCLIPNSSGPCTSTSFFGKLRSGTNKIKEVCISCKNEEKEIESQHPLFEGGICEECKEKWKNHIFESDENGAMTTCAVCAQVGEMLVCGQVTQLFKPTNMDRSPKFPQRKNRIRVLSLYDGISTGAFQLDDYHENANSGELSEITLNTFFPSKLVENGYSGTPAELGGYYCLTKLGFKIDAYFSSGVEENAAVVSKMHFGDKITPVGEVENLTHLHIDCLRPIDVVIGGSSCNDLSGFKPASKKFDAYGEATLDQGIFVCGTICSQRVEKMRMTKSMLDAQACQQQTKTLMK
ncbi:DNA (cytosine-5)-methyltransferase 3A-like [Hetaerina americana]|uniref:DNA (cytosine-5)-methyltransferase 3A-like n=1 Tax=Hetaerina americana TaxID=62018 RepID=UPI003A7F24C0